MKPLRFVLCALGSFVFARSLAAEVFRYQYREGDTYRVLSTVAEDISINGAFYTHSDIINRISVAVTHVEGTKGRLEAAFMTTEKYRASLKTRLVFRDAAELHCIPVYCRGLQCNIA